MKKILVTGSKGQLARKIRELSCTVNEFNFIFASKDKVDITNTIELQRFFSSEKIDILINCAAFTNVDGAESTYDQANKVNNLAVREISNLSEIYDFIFVHISTDAVFDGSKGKLYREKDKTNPWGVYGKSKLKGEEAIQESKCKSIIVRTSWLYSKEGTNFVNKIITSSDEEKEVKVVNDQFGSPTYAGDLSEAIIHIIKSKNFLEAANNKEIFHFCNNGVCSWYEFAQEIKKQGNLQCKIRPCSSDEFESLPKRPSHSGLDNTKFSQRFNFDIKTWKDSLKNCLQEGG